MQQLVGAQILFVSLERIHLLRLRSIGGLDFGQSVAHDGGEVRIGACYKAAEN